MGNLTWGAPRELVLGLKSIFDTETLVETGTFLGDTAAWAAEHFANVITLEASEKLYRIAKSRHARLDNISFLKGNSAEQLPEVVAGLDRVAMFWLDAHYSAGPTFGAKNECPLLAELEAIDSSSMNHVILIDDARLFQAPPPPPHKLEHWPDIGQVVGKLLANKKRHVTIVEDVIIAAPLDMADLVGSFLRNYILRNPPTLPTYAGWAFAPMDIERLMRLHGISSRGVVHVGAHIGQELPTYLRMGFKRALLVEPNPEVFKRLEIRARTVLPQFPKSNCKVQLAQYVISDVNGDVSFHLNTHDQSSSLLRLKDHKEIYPKMLETETLRVRSLTLDKLIEVSQAKFEQFNVLNIDVQGAEMLALSGADKCLRHIDAIFAEINFSELYEDCALAWQLDEYLQGYGFERVATYHPSHLAYGDAFYVKRIKVSAIVSTYAGEALIQDRMENLVQQSLFKTGCMEIIVVDSGSPQNERTVVESFIAKYPDRIKYIRTVRETIYAAFNRAIKVARGKYLTVQNVDDRMKLDSIKKMAAYLDCHPSCVLVHGDQEAAPRGIEFNLEALSKRHWNWRLFVPELLLLSTQVGSQPMWRTSAHYLAGYYDPELSVLGDREFYLRLSSLGDFHYLPEVLGSLDYAPLSLSRGNQKYKQEATIILKRYMQDQDLAKLLNFRLTGQGSWPRSIRQWLRNEYCCKFIERLNGDGTVIPVRVINFLIQVLASVEKIPDHQACVQGNLTRMREYSDSMTSTAKMLQGSLCLDRIARPHGHFFDY